LVLSAQTYWALVLGCLVDSPFCALGELAFLLFGSWLMISIHLSLAIALSTAPFDYCSGLFAHFQLLCLQKWQLP
jgi:hypothetical protein